MRYEYVLPTRRPSGPRRASRRTAPACKLTLREFAWAVGGRWQTVWDLENGKYSVQPPDGEDAGPLADDLVAWSKQKQRNPGRLLEGEPVGRDYAD